MSQFVTVCDRILKPDSESRVRKKNNGDYSEIEMSVYAVYCSRFTVSCFLYVFAHSIYSGIFISPFSYISYVLKESYPIV